MNPKRPPSSEEQTNDSLFKRLKSPEHRGLKYSKVVLRFDSKVEYECRLTLLSLVTYSVKITRCLEASLDAVGKGSAAVGEHEYGRCPPIVIDMPGLKCGVDILSTVEDIVEGICCGVKDESDISMSNVVTLFRAAELLQMDIVTHKTLTFLEKNVFISWEKCMDVLAQFDCNDHLPRSNAPDLKREEENDLFERCRKAFIGKIAVSDKRGCTARCSVECLLRVAQLLPPNAAKNIYESFRTERFGLFLESSNSTGLTNSISSHLIRVSTFSGEHSTSFYRPRFFNSEIRWMEGLPSLLPDLSSRRLLVQHLAKMMCLGSEVASGISISFLSWGFLCALLAEASRLSTRGGKFGLDVEIDFLAKLVSQGLERLETLIYGFEDALKVVTKFKFGTLLSIVKHFRNIASAENIDHVAKLIDKCIVENLKTSSFTTRQALMIYKEFPNNARSSHVELYQTFRTTTLSVEEVL